MKRKTITLVIYMLVCISLVSVGFAAWVITGGDNAEATGNVTASVVTDSSITIAGEKWDSTTDSTTVTDESTGVVSGGTINFGAKEGVANDSWLQSSGTDYEDLTAIFYFSISTKEGNIKSSVSSLQACTIDVSDTVGELRTKYKLIGDPIVEFKVSTSEFTITKETTGLTTYNKNNPNLQSAFTSDDTFANNVKIAYVAIRITYTWGSAFGGDNPVNPYEYFDGKTPSADSGVLKSLYIENGTGNLSYKEFAYEALNKLNKTLAASSGDDFTLVINFESK